MPRRLVLSLIAACALAAAQPAYAIDDPAFTIRLGVMNTEAEGELNGSSEFAGQPFELNESFSIGDDEVTPRVDGMFRFGGRHRLVFDYWRYDQEGRVTLDEDVTGGGVTIPAGSFAAADMGLDLAGLVYDFAVVETANVSLGLQAGVQYAKLEAGIEATAGSDSFEARESTDGFAPAVGARLEIAPAPQWRLIGQARYLDAGWGDIGDLEGDFQRINALAEYRFTPNLGIHAGYDWIEIELEDSGPDGALEFTQEFKGPVAGVTFAF